MTNTLFDKFAKLCCYITAIFIIVFLTHLFSPLSIARMDEKKFFECLYNNDEEACHEYLRVTPSSIQGYIKCENLQILIHRRGQVARHINEHPKENIQNYCKNR